MWQGKAKVIPEASLNFIYTFVIKEKNFALLEMSVVLECYLCTKDL